MSEKMNDAEFAKAMRTWNQRRWRAVTKKMIPFLKRLSKDKRMP